MCERWPRLKLRFQKCYVELKMKIRDSGMSLATVCDVVPLVLSLARLDTRLLYGLMSSFISSSP